MSTTLDKQALVRMTWCTEMRRQGHRQCRGAYRDTAGSVCALGLLLEVAVPAEQFGDRKWDLVPSVGALAGLNPEQSKGVADMNDSGATFAEITDVVEGWFK